MSYRSIYIKKANQIRLENNSLVIMNEEEETGRYPLEDISIILLEDRHTKISCALLGELSKYSISMIFVNDVYQPSSICLPLHSHYKELYVFQKQMEVKKPTYNQCWKRIVEQKILNQQFAIAVTTNDDKVIEQLGEYAKKVQAADKTNTEAIAARIYFGNIFGEMFTRSKNAEDPINAALNYGYTIIMANMTRVLACYGFNTALGIHHESYVNHFNLSCDLMEPFRPVVDMYVYNHLDTISYPLFSETKKGLIHLLQLPVKIDGKKYRLENAQHMVVQSLQKVIEENNSDYLLLPELLVEMEDNDDEL